MQQGATLYTVQLGLNLLWMPLFFGLGRPLEATVDIVALTGVVGYLTQTWSQVDETSAWLMAPYLTWLSFATYLSVRPHRRPCSPDFLANSIHRPDLGTSTTGLSRTSARRTRPSDVEANKHVSPLFHECSVICPTTI